MNSEKLMNEQRKAFVQLIKNQIKLAKANPFVAFNNQVSITLPVFTGMNQENIKPMLHDALGYIPEIILFQETEVVLHAKDNQPIPVVLVIVKIH